MQHASAGISHMGSNHCNLQFAHEFLGSGTSAFYAEGYYTASAVRHIFLCALIVFVAGQTGIICHQRRIVDLTAGTLAFQHQNILARTGSMLGEE